MSIAALITILVICLLFEGFFSGSEMAMVNADKLKLALATDAGSRRALSALHLAKRPATFFTVTLLGTNICTITGSVVCALFIINRFGEQYASLAILYWPFTLVLGEIVPKSVYQHYSDRIVLRIAPVLLTISFILYPIVWVFSKFTDLVLGRVKKKGASDTPISREELEFIIEAEQSGASDVRPQERTLISRLFDLADKKVRQIMTPLVDVISVQVGASRDEASRILDEHGFSRVPVVDGRAFNVVGVLTGTDLLFGEGDKTVRDLMRSAYFVPEEMPLDELLVSMKRGGKPLAIAVDEYGAATGIATIEDLMEEVVGEIRDEHDEAPQLFQRVGRHRYFFSGRMEIAEANERFKLEIPPGQYQTLAGYVIHVLERIPRPGDAFTAGRYSYRVIRASERAVQEIEVFRMPERVDGGKTE